MPARKSKVPNIYNIHVPINLAAHPSAAQALLVDVIKHLAFSREQCHAPYTQLETHARACQQQQQMQLEQRMSRKRLPSHARKAVKYFERLSALLQLAGNIPFQQLQGMAVAVLLGSSVQRPREVYCLHYPPATQHPGVVQPPADQAMSAASRKLLRALILENQTVLEWDEPPGPTKMWLMFQAADGVLVTAPEGFTIRRAFNISLRKAFQVNLLMGGQVPQHNLATPHATLLQQQPQLPVSMPAPVGCHGGMEVDELSQQLSLHMSIADAGKTEATPVWYQCVLHVKGLQALRSH